MPAKKRATQTYESPLEVDSPFAIFRVHCPRCGQNVWASADPPPVEGDVILAAHDCPGEPPVTV